MPYTVPYTVSVLSLISAFCHSFLGAPFVSILYSIDCQFITNLKPNCRLKEKREYYMVPAQCTVPNWRQVVVKYKYNCSQVVVKYKYIQRQVVVKYKYIQRQVGCK